MTTKDVKRYLEDIGVDKLYKKFQPLFDKLDEWEDKLIAGDLLDEYELKYLGELATGIYGKLSTVTNALESIKERVERNTEYSYLKNVEKVRTQDTTIAKAKARDAISDLRDYYGDFKGYLDTAEKMIYCSQSRLKRETTEKTGKRIDHTGEVSNES